MSLAHVLRAVDEQLALNALFHATASELPVGEVVQHWGPPGRRADDDLIDQLRPKQMGDRRRWDHFFLVEDPACLPALGREDPTLNVYEVTPTARTYKGNWGWIKGMRAWRPPFSHQDRENVYRYWGGVKGYPCLDEYLTESMKVERKVGTLEDFLPSHDTK